MLEPLCDGWSTVTLHICDGGPPLASTSPEKGERRKGKGEGGRRRALSPFSLLLSQ